MPGGDRTGPGGWGPMTGRGAGYCAGYPVPGSANPDWGRGGGGRGWGRGRGGGGWQHRYGYRATGMPDWQRAWMAGPAYPPPIPTPSGPVVTREQELDALKNQAKYFEQALDDLRRRIGEVESSEQGAKTT